MNKIGLPDNQEVISYDGDGTKKKIGSSFYRGKSINLNPYLSDWDRKDFIERYLLKGLVPASPCITKETRITAFGSCFAENITKHLTSRGFSLSKNEEPNIYISSMGEGMVNVHAIEQQFLWALDNESIPEGLWHDQSTEEFKLDEETRVRTREVFLRTEFFIITLGLSEIWYDEETGGVFWRAVPVSKFNAERHKFRVATFSETKQSLKNIIRIIRRYNPKAKILFTLSPVPLAATFREVSCMAANTASKAILRAALDEIIREKSAEFNKTLFYFPSYEIVSELFPAKYCEDGRHPRSEIIGFITALFESTYCRGDASVEELKSTSECYRDALVLNARHAPSGTEAKIDEPALRIINTAYKELMGRSVDPSGRESFLKVFQKKGLEDGILKLLKTLPSSSEFRSNRVHLRFLFEQLVSRDDGIGDLAINHVLSLGSNCLTSSLIKSAGLKKYSGPFDWIFSSPEILIHCIRDDFQTFLDRSHYAQVDQTAGSGARSVNHRWYQKYHGINRMFNHHHPIHDDDYLYFQRCVERFRRIMSSNETKLFVMLTGAEQGLERSFSKVVDVLEGSSRSSASIQVVMHPPKKECSVSRLSLMDTRGNHHLYEMTPHSRVGSPSFGNFLDSLMILQLIKNYRLDLKGLV